MAILDHTGRPIDTGKLRELQTAEVTALRNEFLVSTLGNLSPARISSALQMADAGYLLNQHRLFADLEDRDSHLAGEMQKRAGALLQLSWDIVPLPTASSAEKAAAQWVKETIERAIDDIEDLILACMEGVGHGFSAIELEWTRIDGSWVPKCHPRPQEWFRLSRDRRELRLRDASADGVELRPFGWVLHEHRKAKTGYRARMGLYRVLVWPTLYKFYGIADWAEFLEMYGMPFIVGKYFSGATAAEKSSLMSAVRGLAHDARAIMPNDMAIEISKVAAGGSGDGNYLEMIRWAEGAQSKAILGGTLTTSADSKTSTNALGKVHRDVQHDILESDARQIAATLTKYLVYPLLRLNRGIVDLRSCPRWTFDTSEPEDLTAWADALPKLSALLRIPAPWARERLHMPEPQAGEDVLGGSSTAPTTTRRQTLPRRAEARQEATQAATAILALAQMASIAGGSGEVAGIREAQAAIDGAADHLMTHLDWRSIIDPMIRPLLDALESGKTPEELLGNLSELVPEMDDRALVQLLERALFVAECWGRLSTT